VENLRKILFKFYSFFQQLRFMNNSFPKDEIMIYKSVIYANLILTMGVLYGNLKIQEKNLENSKNEVNL
jgi:hypothetical protein